VPNAYPPTVDGKSGCLTIPTVQGGTTPNFAYMAALPFTNGGLPQLLVEDSANNELYIFSNTGTPGYALPSIKLISPPIALSGGAGPIYTGSFDNQTGNFDKNSNAFFIINGQTNHSATVYLGNGNGGFHVSQTVPGVYSMLLQDMDGDGIPDMVVEGSNGAIEIFNGNGDGTFQTTSEGGTGSGDPHAGDGG